MIGKRIQAKFKMLTAATITVDGQSYPFTPLGEVPQEIIVAGGAEKVVAERLAASS